MTELIVSGAQHPDRPLYTEQDAHLSDRTRDRIAGGVAKETTRAYTRQWATFEEWCRDAGRVALPATPETFAEYVTHLADAGYATSTIQQAMAMIRTAHRTAGHKSQPDTDAARLVLRDHRRKTKRRPKQSTPLLVDELRAMVATCDRGTPRGLRDHTLLVLGLALYGRRSEMVALELDDLTETNDGLLVLLRSSKTDQDAVGVEVPIPYGQYADTCPVRVVRTWVAFLFRNNIAQGRVLRSVRKNGQVGASLSGVAVDAVVKARARAANLKDPEGYSAHSLRAGGATLSAMAGHPLSAIAEHGRWAPGSPTPLRYIRPVDRWRNNPLHGSGM